MDVPNLTTKHGVLLLTLCGVIATMAYLMFLYGSWIQFQQDALSRNKKIDEMLDRLPRKVTNDNAGSSGP